MKMTLNVKLDTYNPKKPRKSRKHSKSANVNNVVTFMHAGWLHMASDDVIIHESGRLEATFLAYLSRVTGRWHLLMLSRYFDITFDNDIVCAIFASSWGRPNRRATFFTDEPKVTTTKNSRTLTL